MNSQRSSDIDLLRVVAIGLMIAYHAAYDLGVLYGWSVDVFHGSWKVTGEMSAILFLLLVGISYELSHRRAPAIARYLRKGLWVLVYGLVVTAATYLFDQESYVRFGILHLIGVCMMLLPLLPRRTAIRLLIAALLFVLQPFVSSRVGETSLLLPFGIMPMAFRSADYYPLIPWAGVILLGSVLGQLYISIGKPTFVPLPTLLQNHIRWISKRSLIIYMVHQPILLLGIRLVLGKP